MKCFLSDQRRRQLMQALMDLTMPAQQAVEMVYLPDDMAAIDWTMAHHARHVISLSEEIGRVGNSDIHRLFDLSAFLAADLLVLQYYKAEAAERDILRDFPHWMEAAAKLVLQ
jgi:hypothetical protein